MLEEHHGFNLGHTFVEYIAQESTNGSSENFIDHKIFQHSVRWDY